MVTSLIELKTPMKRILVSLFFGCICYSAFAQNSEVIRTSRPGQAFVPFTTGKNVFQVQTGITSGGFEDDDLDQSGDNIDYIAAFRYSVLENFEIRSSFRLRRDEIEITETNAVNTVELGGLSFWNVGVRYNIIEGTGFQPSFGFQTEVALNVVDEDYNTEEIAPSFMLMHSQALSETFTLTTNWGVAWNGNDNDPAGLYVINVAFPITDKLGGFIENYGTLVGGDLDARWDTGLGYLINNDFQLDISGGLGRNQGLTDWFIDAGISWRVKLKE